jgi:protein-disulfide isomerase
VRDYVRAGKLRIEFRGLAFIGPDSDKALRAALAAGRQNRLWNVVELLYANQGPENSGWASEELIDRIANSVPGLDVERFDADRRLETLDTGMAEARAQAQTVGVRGTPAFELGPTGSAPEALGLTSLAPDEFAGAIEALLGR